MNSNRFQPPAGTETAQPAIESVAIFTHTYRPPESTEFKGKSHVNFIRSASAPIHAYVINHVARVCMRISSNDGFSDISKRTSAEELEETARHFLDAAHFIRQQARAL